MISPPRSPRLAASLTLTFALPLALGCGGGESSGTGVYTTTGSGSGGSGGAATMSTTVTTTTATSTAATTSSSGGTGGSGGNGSGGSGGAGTTTTTTTTTTTASSTGTGMAICGPDVAAPIVADLGVTTDPEQGSFTLDEALDELPMGPGPLRAIIDTDLGVITCALHPVEAPIGVANFVGLARGRRAFKDPVTKKWAKRRFYDGLLFHRVIPGFMAQGGDPLGTGYGGPGYKFVNEIAGLHHDPGTLSYANAGADTNGSQFFITETEQGQLDASYTIFGACTPLDVVPLLTAVPRDAKDKPLVPLHMKTVTITRCAP
jgi:peptidyl-prolyl cis-trans isomerase A (cyclophilin A)